MIPENTYRNKNWLKQKYWEEVKPLREIAEEAGVGRQTILNWMVKYDIPRRDNSFNNGLEGSRGLQREKNPNWKGRPKLTCRACKEEFEVPPSEEERRTYCSKECKAKGLAEIKGKNHANYDPNAHIELKCDWCGKKFKRVSSLVKEGYHFCCKNCKYEWQSENLSGKNHPNWEGGHESYYGSNFQKQKEKALKRDNHVCQLCGTEEDGKKHDVHHIIPFKKFGLENYEEANKLNNLITLCHSCHLTLEWKNKKTP